MMLMRHPLRTFMLYLPTVGMLLLSLAACTSAGEEAYDNDHTLYYTEPARMWEETLPLGNGRLGMMPDGGVHHEHIVLNEVSLWSGSESDYRNPEAARSLPAIRRLLFEGKNREAQELMYRSFVPRKQETDGRYGSYQMLGNLDLRFEYPQEAGVGDTAVSHYRRSLSLRDAVARTSFRKGGVGYTREYFVSRSRDLVVIHLQADAPEALTFTASLSRPERGTLSQEGDVLVMTGTLDSGNPDVAGMSYRAALRLLAAEGEVSLSPAEGVKLTGGREAWLVLSATTSYEAAGTDFPGAAYARVCDSLLEQAPLLQQDYLSERTAHTEAHRELYDRVSLTLPASEADGLPTDQRLLHFGEQASPALAALYYNYGRYLLIGSTRPGSLPPNLQGLWANGVLTPWNGDYHTNINVQMNHWPLEQAALSELYQPLAALVERLVPSGRESARCFYGDGAEGWVLHMMTNVWNYTAPGEHPSWGATNTGGAWLCAHLWEHYLYSQDMDYLRHIYPLMREAALFFHTTTVCEPGNGWLVTAPTSSPENAFLLPGDSLTPVSVCMGPTMDVQLLTELYRNVIEASRLLGCDEAFATALAEDLTRFPPMQVGRDGRLQEWLQEYTEQDPHHRHVSHLYGLHPGNLITPSATPQLADACRATLEQRGDEGTGWSRAWKINFWARLGDGNRAWKLFRNLLQPAVDGATGRHGSGTFPNLFCSHPPFQIDGNFGGAAGIGEMLLQSHEGFIRLLPALPDAWHTGSFRGMRVRGGAAVDLDWKDGRASRAKVTALHPGTFVLRMPQGVRRAKVSQGGRHYTVEERQITLSLGENESCELLFN